VVGGQQLDCKYTTITTTTTTTTNNNKMKNDIMKFVGKWMELEKSIQSKVF
jgi:flagellar capping protein FliD